jgi:hypothetical protein
VELSKLDGALVNALSTADSTVERLPVFIRTDADLPAEAKRILSTHGISGTNENVSVFAADLSPDTLDQLSEHSWVKSIALARHARPMTPARVQPTKFER